MLAFILAGIPAGLAAYLMSVVFGPGRRRILIYAIGVCVGLAAGIAVGRLFTGRYDIPIVSLLGAAVGPFAALRASRPYSFE